MRLWPKIMKLHLKCGDTLSPGTQMEIPLSSERLNEYNFVFANSLYINCKQFILPPSPRWKPRALRESGKLDMLTPSLPHWNQKYYSHFLFTIVQINEKNCLYALGLHHNDAEIKLHTFWTSGPTLVGHGFMTFGFAWVKPMDIKMVLI
jgi:hypothetical protein